MLAGVCGGIAEYFGQDSTLIRLLAVLIAVVSGGVAVIAYIVLALVVPEDASVGEGEMAMVEGSMGPGDVPESGAQAGATPHNASSAPQGAPPPEGWSSAGYQPSPPGPPLAQPERERGKGTAGIVVGAALVVLGLLFVAERVVPGLSVWTLWPLLVVAMGIAEMFRAFRDSEKAVKHLLDGAVIIVVGGILLSNAMGFLPWDVWLNIFSLWPLLLVAVGVDIVGRSLGSVWVRGLGSLIVIGGLLFGALAMPARGFGWWGAWSWSPSSATSERFSERVAADPSVERGEARVSGGVGEIGVGDGPDLVSVEGDSPFGDPRFEVSSSGGMAEVEVATHESGRRVFGPSARSRLDVELSRDVEWDIELRTGVSGLEADLSRLEVHSLDAETGVSDSTIKLGSPPLSETPVRLKAGVSAIEVRLPEGEAIKLRVRRGLSGVEIPDGFDKRSSESGAEVWETSGFSGATNSWEILLETGISGIEVKWY